MLAGAVALPLGLRAVNGMLPDAAATSSYLPTVETPRPREPFDETAAAALREAQPDYFVIGDSMAGARVDPRHLSARTGRDVAALFTPGTPVAYWYLQFKNLVVENDLTRARGAIFFFRDDQLTTQVEVTPGVLDRVARDLEPELDRILAAHRLGTFSEVHRLARSVYQFDRTRLWLEPRLTRAPAVVAAPPPMQPAGLLDALNTDVFALDRLRKFAAADLPAAQDAALDFDAQVDRSLLPAIVRLGQRSNIRVAFVRAQRRPSADGPPVQSEALRRYIERLNAYLTANGAYFHDDWGDPEQPLAVYADGDHLIRSAIIPYTDRFAEKHARFFQ